MKKQTLLFTLLISSLFAQDAALIDENPGKQWLTTELKNKSAPEWVRNSILDIDTKIKDETARKFFRRFLSDPATRSDAVTKFVEYLAVAKDEPDTIYKAIYYALTYTIMDGLPTGPLKEEVPQEEEKPILHKEDNSNEPNVKPLNSEEKEDVKLLTSPVINIPGAIESAIPYRMQARGYASGTQLNDNSTKKIYGAEPDSHSRSYRPKPNIVNTK